jgi:hypothetical protein
VGHYIHIIRIKCNDNHVITVILFYYCIIQESVHAPARRPPCPRTVAHIIYIIYIILYCIVLYYYYTICVRMHLRDGGRVPGQPLIYYIILYYIILYYIILYYIIMIIYNMCAYAPARRRPCSRTAAPIIYIHITLYYNIIIIYKMCTCVRTCATAAVSPDSRSPSRASRARMSSTSPRS